MTFRQAYADLLAQLHTRIRNGGTSQREVARELGISQPHMNNVLKGRRTLSFDRADLLLKSIDASLVFLSPPPALRNRTSATECSPGIPVLAPVIGPGSSWTLKLSPERCSTSGSLPELSPRTAFGRIALDPHMPSVTSAYDLALLDMSAAARRLDCPDSLFLVCPSNEPLLRWLRRGCETLYLADEFSLNLPLLWRPLPVHRGELLPLVKARVVWLGREELPRPKPEPGHAPLSPQRSPRRSSAPSPPRRSS